MQSVSSWNIGCSGFHYKHWKGTFYPEKLAQNKWFSYYCQYFKTLELNVTFYRFPQLSFLESWYIKSPPDFLFSVKAPRAITHYKQFNETEDLLFDFYKTIREGLKEKLGCVLFQMPPRFHFTTERLDKIISSLDPSFQNVVEFRHESWWNEDIYRELGKHHISFCGMSHPSLPSDIICNTNLLYYRLHGKDQLYASNYKEKELIDIYHHIKTNCHAITCYLFFNNDINTYAIHNALFLKEVTENKNH